MLPCKTCKGEGKVHHEGFTDVHGKEYPSRSYPCSSCKATGQFPEIDEAAIRAEILAGQGKNKGKLRAAFSSNGAFRDIAKARAYYVWRLARFHGGKDMTMPITADTATRGDPYKDQLDKLADTIAKESFGTDLAAAVRWGSALGL